MCGIFAYLHYNLTREQAWVLRLLVAGLKRLEYRGYDSAGVCVDRVASSETTTTEADAARLFDIFKSRGDIKTLEASLPFAAFERHSRVTGVAIAHTRWATHGEPSDTNAHPQPSDALTYDFVVVHNGIITNYASLKASLTKQGYAFASDTDTEVISVFLKYVYDNATAATGEPPSFRALVTTVTSHLDGAYAIIVKSRHYPNEMVAAKIGSPLIVGIRVAAKGGDATTAAATTTSAQRAAAAATTTTSSASIPITYASLNAGAGGASGADPAAAGGAPLRALSPTHHSDDGSSSPLIHAAVRSASLPRSRSPLGGAGDGDGDGAGAGAGAGDGAPPPIEYFVSSDVAAIVEHTDQACYLEDGDLAYFSADGRLHLQRGKQRDPSDPTERPVEKLHLELDQISKRGYAHFMLKEIFEQPDAMFDTIRGRITGADYDVVLGGLKTHVDGIRRCRRLVFIACGSSYHSALACRQLLEELSQLPVDVQLASDFLDRRTPIFRDDSCFFVSQSGETADTLLALKYCLQRGAMTIGVVNAVGSAIARLTHCGVYVNAGAEIGVASTKAYTCQLVAIVLIALYIGQERRSAQPLIRAVVDELRTLPAKLKRVLAEAPRYEAIAQRLVDKRDMLLIGRGYQYATCLEAALKIKEIAYVHCEAVLAGELKHGPLALVDGELALGMVLTRDELYDKSLNAFHQVIARGGKPLLLIDDENAELAAVAAEHKLDTVAVPRTHACLQALVNVVPLQLISYYMAVAKGCNVDRPRNLAKSVTVE